jgi:hypothetical protein
MVSNVETAHGFTNLIQVLQAPPQEAGSEVTILTLELYEDGLILRHLIPNGSTRPSSPEMAALNPLGLMSLTLRDNLGTAYALHGAVAGGSHGFTMFKPAVPDEADWLEMMTKSGFVRFDF